MFKIHREIGPPVVESTILNTFIYLKTKCYIKSVILPTLEPIENWGVFPIFLID